MKSNSKNPVFILSLFDTGLYVGRLLKNYNIPIFGFDYDKNNTGFYSNFIKAVKIDYPLSKNNNALDVLLSYRSKFQEKPILIPASEIFLRFIEINRDILQEEFLFILPDNKILNKIINRVGQFEIATNSGFKVPKYIEVTGMEDIKKVKDKMQFPAIIKGIDQVLWKKQIKKKIIFVDNYNEFCKIALKLLKDNIYFFLQEIIEGSVNNNFEFNALVKDGVVVEFNVNQKILQYPLEFGSACHLQNVRNDKIEMLGRKFVIENKIEGFSNTEFKYNFRTKQYYFIETNARVWQQIELTNKLGQNFVLRYYNLLTNNKILVSIPKKFESISWIDLPPYLLIFIRHRRKANLKFLQFILSIVKAKYLGVFCIRDIKPFLKAIKLLR